MRTRVLLIALTLPAACFVATDDHSLGSAPPDGGLAGGAGATGGGSGGPGGGTGSFEHCVQLVSYGQLCTTVFPVVCGGVTCASGEVCCQTTGACVAAGAGSCPKPTTNEPNGYAACGSNADCQSDEFCMGDDVLIPGVGSTQRCIGNSGHCQPQSLCGFCSAPGDLCMVCGCDGRTYASDQVACVAGVHTIHRGKCGVPAGTHDGGAYTIACGTNDQCPANAQCCFRTGKCFDLSEPWRCELQPNGTILDCASNEECASGAGGGSGSEPPTSYCAAAADGCGGGPGLCSSRGSTNSCGGEVQPACGCDGVTYVNACWARAAGTRLAASGACP